MKRVRSMRCLTAGLFVVLVTTPSCRERPDAGALDEGAVAGAQPGDSLVPLYEIGDEDWFGSIDGLLILGGSRLAVLDKMSLRVSLFTTIGALLSEIGRAGQGPGEFSFPVALQGSPQDAIVVLDQGNLRLTTLSWGSDSLQVVSEVRVPLQAMGMCLIGERIFLLGARDGMLLHEIDAEGNVLRSFFEIGEDPVTSMLAALATIRCSEGANAIAYVSYAAGTLQLFSPEGELLASDSIPDYVRMIWHRQNEATVTREMPPEGFVHMTTSITWFGDQVLILLGRFPDDGNPLREGRLYSLSQGAWRQPARAWPDVLAVAGDTVFSRKAEPYPVIQVYEARR